MKVKTVLVSQPEPSSERSPYNRLKDKYKLTIDFIPFIFVEGVKAKEVRQQKIDFSKFDNIIFHVNYSNINFFKLQICKYIKDLPFLE